MGKLVHFRKKETGLLAQYVESVIDATGQIKDIDFEIVSMIVMDNEYDTFSLGSYLGIRSNDIFRGNSGFFRNRGKKQIYYG